MRVSRKEKGKSNKKQYVDTGEQEDDDATSFIDMALSIHLNN